MPTLLEFICFLQEQYQQPYKLGKISQDEYTSLVAVFTLAYDKVPSTAALAARALMVELGPTYIPSFLDEFAVGFQPGQYIKK